MSPWYFYLFPKIGSENLWESFTKSLKHILDQHVVDYMAISSKCVLQHCRLCGQVARSLLTRAPRVARSRSGWVEASHGNLAASWHHTHILSPTLARYQDIAN